MMSKELFQRFLLSAFIIGGFFAMGCLDGIKGPTLIGLSRISNSSINQMSWIYPCSSTGSIFGSIVTGSCFDKWPQWRMSALALTMILMACTNLLLPFIPILEVMILVSIFQGISIGCLDSGSTLLATDIWRNARDGPILLAISFGYCLGTFFGPSIATNFLSDSSTSVPLEDEKISLQILYGIVSSICTLAGVCLFLGHCFLIKGVLILNQKETEEHPEENLIRTREVRRLTGTFHAILAAFFFVTTGMAQSFGIYLAPFSAISGLHLTPQDGAALTALYYGVSTLVGGIIMLIAFKVKGIFIISLNIIATALGSFVLLGGDSSVSLLKCSTILLGIGISTLFSSGILWAKESAEMTNKIRSLFSATGSAGIIIFPLLIGQVIENSPNALSYVMVTMSFANIVIILITYFISKRLL